MYVMLLTSVEMAQRPFKRTRKAELYRLSNGLLLKRYFTKKALQKACQDQRSLRYLNQHFGQVTYRGWLYRIVRYVGMSPDRKASCMEYVTGCVLAAIPKSKMKEAEFHCGIWLALYHNKVLKGNTDGLIFTDLNAHNIILDFEKNCVTAIDPGETWGRIGSIYEDLIKHINSALFLMVRRKAPPLAIIEFLSGYVSVNEAKLSLLSYYKGLCQELTRQFVAHTARSYSRSLLYLSSIVVLSFFYLFFVPVYLFSKTHR